jgi:hypothetical protein
MQANIVASSLVKCGLNYANLSPKVKNCRSECAVWRTNDRVTVFAGT